MSPELRDTHLGIVGGEAKVLVFRRERVATAALVRAHLAGDSTAMQTLYTRYGAEFLGVAARILGTRTEADDAMHDTFVTVLQKLSTLRDPSGFRGWTLRILINECRGRLRKRRFFRYFDGSAEDTSLVFEGMAAAARDSEASAELMWLSRHVGALPADERIAWSLRYVEGYQVEECANVLGVSVATVKRRTAAALRRLGQAGYRGRSNGR